MTVNINKLIHIASARLLKIEHQTHQKMTLDTIKEQLGKLNESYKALSSNNLKLNAKQEKECSALLSRIDTLRQQLKTSKKEASHKLHIKKENEAIKQGEIGMLESTIKLLMEKQGDVQSEMDRLKADKNILDEEVKIIDGRLEELLKSNQPEEKKGKAAKAISVMKAILPKGKAENKQEHIRLLTNLYSTKKNQLLDLESKIQKGTEEIQELEQRIEATKSRINEIKLPPKKPISLEAKILLQKDKLKELKERLKNSSPKENKQVREQIELQETYLNELKQMRTLPHTPPPRSQDELKESLEFFNNAITGNQTIYGVDKNLALLGWDELKKQIGKETHELTSYFQSKSRPVESELVSINRHVAIIEDELKSLSDEPIDFAKLQTLLTHFELLHERTRVRNKAGDNIDDPKIQQRYHVLKSQILMLQKALCERQMRPDS